MLKYLVNLFKHRLTRCRPITIIAVVGDDKRLRSMTTHTGGQCASPFVSCNKHAVAYSWMRFLF